MIDITTKMVADAFEPICREHGLQIVSVRPGEVTLVSRKYALHLYTSERDDTIRYAYVDIDDRTGDLLATYSVDTFLELKRPMPVSPARSRPSSEEEWARMVLRSIAERFRLRGEDILSGDKGWLKDYPETWSISPVWPSAEKTIRCVLKGRQESKRVETGTEPKRGRS